MLVGEVHLSQLEQVKYRKDLNVYFAFPLSHVILAMTLIVAILVA